MNYSVQPQQRDNLLLRDSSACKSKKMNDLIILFQLKM